MGFFLETLIGGLMAGMLYSLIALGFVLIFKASGVFNFAQGAMVLFAALAMARFATWLPDWLGFESRALANLLAFLIAMAVMIVLAWLVERLVLRKLVNQEGITLLMATLGIAYFLDGFGQTLFGSDIYSIDVGMPKDPILLFEGLFEGGLLVNTEELYAALVAAALVAFLTLFFQVTRTGRALRAVAEARGVKAGALIHAVRVALTGRTASPGLFDVAALLGRNRTLARLAAALRMSV